MNIMSTKDNNPIKNHDDVDFVAAIDAYRRAQNLAENPEYIEKELRKQFRFPDEIWEKLSKR